MAARNALRDSFLRSNYDYIIMFDDDAIISGSKDDAIALIVKFDANIIINLPYVDQNELYSK